MLKQKSNYDTSLLYASSRLENTRGITSISHTHLVCVEQKCCLYSVVCSPSVSMLCMFYCVADECGGFFLFVLLLLVSSSLSPASAFFYSRFMYIWQHETVVKATNSPLFSSAHRHQTVLHCCERASLNHIETDIEPHTRTDNTHFLAEKSILFAFDKNVMRV